MEHSLVGYSTENIIFQLLYAKARRFLHEHRGIERNTLIQALYVHIISAMSSVPAPYITYDLPSSLLYRLETEGHIDNVTRNTIVTYLLEIFRPIQEVKLKSIMSSLVPYKSTVPAERQLFPSTIKSPSNNMSLPSPQSPFMNQSSVVHENTPQINIIDSSTVMEDGSRVTNTHLTPVASSILLQKQQTPLKNNTPLAENVEPENFRFAKHTLPKRPGTVHNWRLVASDVSFETMTGIGLSLSDAVTLHCINNHMHLCPAHESFKKYYGPRKGALASYTVFYCSCCSSPELAKQHIQVKVISHLDAVNVYDIYWNGMGHCHTTQELNTAGFVGAGWHKKVPPIAPPLSFSGELSPVVREALLQALTTNKESSLTNIVSSVSRACNLLVYDSAYLEKVQYAIKHAAKYQRQAHSRINRPAGNHVVHLMQLVNSKSLLLHLESIGSHPTEGYIPLSDFQKMTLSELKQHLGVKSSDQIFTVPIKEEDFLSSGGEDDVLAEVKGQLVASVLVVTIPWLCNILSWISNGLMDYLPVNIDDVYKLVSGGIQGLVSGTTDIDYRDSLVSNITDLPTRFFRPFAVMITLCQNRLATRAMLGALRRIAQEVFHVSFHPKVFVIDTSATIKAGIKGIFPDSKIIMCYPHVIMWIKKQGKKYWNHVNMDGQRSTEGYIIHHVTLLRNCTTRDQFVTLFNLIYLEWCDNGLEQFAVQFQKQYGPDSGFCNWFIGSTGLYFILPSNNPIEGYFSSIKGNPRMGRDPRLQLNVSMFHFVTREIGKLSIKEEETAQYYVGIGRRCTANKYISPGDEMLGLLACMDYDVDVKEVVDERQNSGHVWYVNSPPNFGRAITEERITSFHNAYEGRQVGPTTPDDVARSIFSFCCLTENKLDAHPGSRLMCTGYLCTCPFFNEWQVHWILVPLLHEAWVKNALSKLGSFV
jgi:hypothetical protein